MFCENKNKNYINILIIELDNIIRKFCSYLLLNLFYQIKIFVISKRAS